MEIDSIIVESVSVPPRLRQLDENKVKALAASMESIGLQQPITVFDPNGEQTNLVAGHHRLAAARLLGWEDIPGIWTDAADLDRQLWEIDENLIRSELTELERADHLKRRKEIFDARSSAEKIPTTQTSKRGRKGEGRPKEFDQDTADKTGLDKSTIRKSRTRAERIVPEVQEAIKAAEPNTPLAKAADVGVELDAVAALKPQEQKDAVEMIEAGSATSFRDARDFIQGDEEERKADQLNKEMSRLLRLWNSVSQETRDRFLQTIEAGK